MIEDNQTSKYGGNWLKPLKTNW